MNRPSKRQRQQNPKSWQHNHSLACVASPLKFGGDPIGTAVASAQTREVFLDRLQKEIIGPLNLYRGKKVVTLNDHAPAAETTGGSATMSGKGRPWPKRIVVGTNQCTRALEKALRGETSGTARPSLVVLARDIYPPTILSHIPVMAHQLLQPDGKTALPILLLPGRASKELGKAFGPKNVSILVFLGEDDDFSSGGNQSKEEDLLAEQRISSFVKFVTRSLLPTHPLPLVT
jgi:ribosomal protein L7Ae-like RNA K-turn-binding protein